MLSPVKRSGRAASILALAAGAIASGAACNLIAGINEGNLVDSSTDGGSHKEAGSGLDATNDRAVHRDAPAADARGDTGHPLDAGHDTGLPLEAGRDASVPAQTCTAMGSPTLIEDLTALANVDSGALSYSSGPFVAPLGTNVHEGVLIASQILGDPSEFIVYVPPFNGNSSLRLSQAGNAPGSLGLALLDVESNGFGVNESVNALIANSFSGRGGPGHSSLQVVPLATVYPGGSQANPYDFQFSSGAISGAQLVAMPPNDAGETLAFVTSALAFGSRYGVNVGITGPLLEGGAGPTLLYEQGGAISVTGDYGFFAAGSSLYVLTPPLSIDAGVHGGFLDFVAADNGDGGVVGSLAPPPGSPWGLLGAKRSAADPSKAVLLAYAADVSRSGVFDTYGSTVLPATIPSLTVGQAPFSAGGHLPVASYPSTNQSIAWSGDDFVLVGTNAGGTGILLLWLAPTGEIVATTPLPVVSTTGSVTIMATGVSFESAASESVGATLGIAWIESSAPDSGALGSQRLFAQQITCVPTP